MTDDDVFMDTEYEEHGVVKVPKCMFELRQTI